MDRKRLADAEGIKREDDQSRLERMMRMLLEENCGSEGQRGRECRVGQRRVQGRDVECLCT